MSTKRLTTDQRADISSSSDDLKRSINTLTTSSPENPAPNPFIVGRNPKNGNGRPPQNPALKPAKSSD